MCTSPHPPSCSAEYSSTSERKEVVKIQLTFDKGETCVLCGLTLCESTVLVFFIRINWGQQINFHLNTA